MAVTQDEQARTLSGPLGILQGRLTPSHTGELQCFPDHHWREEFESAAQLGLDHIELLVDRETNPCNPLWTESGRAEIGDMVARSGVRLLTTSIDYVMANDLRDERTCDWMTAVAPLLAQVGVTVAVVPLYEASEATLPPERPVLRHLRRIADAYAGHGIKACLETLLPGGPLLQFLEIVDHHNVGVCYDTGNTTAAGHDTVADIELLNSAIWHVHIKDKDAHGVNVPLGEGRADLVGCLRMLARNGYPGALTMETARGDDPIATASRHADLVRSLIR